MKLFSPFFSYSDKPFVGASVGYFSFLFLLAGRALTVSIMLIFQYAVVNLCQDKALNSFMSLGSSFSSHCGLFSQSASSVCV